MSLRRAIPTAAELGAAARAYLSATRGGAFGAAPDWDHAPDETVLELLSKPFASAAETAERLGAAERRLRERGDRRSVFLTVYAAMTETVDDGLRSGRFADPAWVEAYLVAFADRYRAAFVAYERGAFADVPPPWLVAFRAAAAGQTLVVQDALLGVNAHINYDLAYTLCDVGVDPDRQAKHSDHAAVNGVLADLVDAVQAALATTYAAGGLSDADAVLGELDEATTLLGLREARRLAWDNAVLRTDAPVPWVGAYVDWRVRVVATGLAYAVLRPGRNTALSARLREFERSGATLDAVAEAVRAATPSRGADADT